MREEKQKLQGKDYITGGIFSLLCMVAMLIAAIMNMSGYTAPFYPVIAAFLIGILYVIVVCKVSKPGIIFVFSVIPCIYFFTSGLLEGIIGAIGTLIYAMLAELIIHKEFQNKKKIILSGIIYTMYTSTIGIAESFIATDTYCDNALEHGINAMIVEQMRTFYHVKPLWLIIIVTTALTTFLGILIGIRIMNKHLKKAGMM